MKPSVFFYGPGESDILVATAGRDCGAYTRGGVYFLVPGVTREMTLFEARDYIDEHYEAILKGEMP